MTDRHMNLFYSYNESNHLIENNLTRAWILSLKLLSGAARDCLLKALLAGPFCLVNKSGSDRLPSFANAEFALQANMSKARAKQARRRYILAIASDRYEDISQETSESVARNMVSAPSTFGGGSIPDAWICEKQSYVYLVESKIGRNPLTAPQLYGEASDWLGYGEQEAREHILSLTWDDVLEAIEQTRQTASPGLFVLNEQEHNALTDLEQYLGFYGYRQFGRFEFNQLKTHPAFLVLPDDLMDFAGLSRPPAFHLSIAQDSTD